MGKRDNIKPGRRATLSLAGVLVAIGIVFGDIGTSPLYVMKAIVAVRPAIDDYYILGAVSCIIWTLTLQTTVKYVLIALRADNKGEGGIMALFALLRRSRGKLFIAAAIGAAAVIADGMLTPASTVTSAIEGMSYIAGGLDVLPPVVVVIVLIFVLQQLGTEKIGRFFGPFMLLWFLMLGALGAFALAAYPGMLKAFNPWYAVRLLSHSPEWFLIMGAVFLCVTGAEALYSDLGHCGRRNITAGWFFVKTMLILNYLGQGAYLLVGKVAEGENPFYSIVPQGFVAPVVVMATCAAIIASQALLSGSFTIFSEAVNLNFWPQLKIKYPTVERGQLYIPSVNWIMLAGCLLTVAIFRSSARMEAAYGLSITIAMLMTTVLLTIWLRRRGVNRILCCAFGAFYLMYEGVFFVANIAKFAHGGWYSLLIAAVVAAVMMVWYRSTAMRAKFIEFKKLSDSIPLINAISEDREIPKYSSNVVYLSRSESEDMIESKVLYSIINKQPKRADHYWFIHICHDDSPEMLSYKVHDVLPGKVYAVSMRIGFRVSPQVSVYLRQVVEDLVAEGRLDLTSTYPSLRENDIAGDFKFIILRRIFSASSNCRRAERGLLMLHDRLRRIGVSEREAYGLDTSMVTMETVPLILSTTPGRRIIREP